MRFVGKRSGWLLAGLAVVAAPAVGWYVWAWATRPVLPAVDLTGADPAVVAAVESTSAEVRAAPQSDAAWGRLGVVLYAHNYTAESACCFAQAGRLNPREARWPILQAAAVRNSDPDAAVALLERVLALPGAASDALESEAAELYLQQGRFDDARLHFERVLHHHPDDARAHIGLARAAAASDDLAGSLAHLNFALGDPHTRKSAWRLQAEVLERRGDHAAALRSRAQAEEAAEDLAWPEPVVDEVFAVLVGKEAGLNRILELEQQGRHDEAEALAHKVEDQYPDVFWLVEGRMKKAQARWAEAEAALRKAVELAPASVDARYDLGNVLIKENKYDAAAECFGQVIEREPGYGLAHYNLGLCKKMLGDRQGAERAYRLAVEYAPYSAESHRDLGELLLQDGRNAEAVAQLRQALQLEPADETAKKLLRQAAP